MKIVALIIMASAMVWLPIAFMDAMLLQASIDAMHAAARPSLAAASPAMIGHRR